MLPSHPLRETLHNEVHARPYERLTAPLLLSHVAMFGPPAGAAYAHMVELLRKRHLPQPAVDANHLSADLGGVHLRWEKHTEFHTCTFWKPLAETNPALASADRVFERHNQKAKIPGFRPGKAPRAMYERSYGAEHLWAEAAEDLVVAETCTRPQRHTGVTLPSARPVSQRLPALIKSASL